MKKTLTLIVMMLVCQLVAAQNAQNLFDKYRNDGNTKYQMFTQNMLIHHVKDVNDSRAALVKKIDYVKILMFSQPTKTQRTEIPDGVKELEGAGYCVVTNSSGTGEVNSVAFIMTESGEITDAVLFQATNSTGMLMRITGHMTADEMVQLGELLKYL